jgi:hypothetical protein
MSTLCIEKEYRMRISSRPVFFLVLALLGRGVAMAADFGGLDLQPLLMARESKKMTFNVGPVDGTIEEEHSLFITRSGATVLDLVARTNQDEWHAQSLRGVGTGAQLASLNQVLSDSKIGRFKSCSKVVAEGLEARYEITWFGWNNRSSKSISIIYTPGPISGSAPCPADVDMLIQGIGVYERDFAANPETSVDR